MINMIDMTMIIFSGNLKTTNLIDPEYDKMFSGQQYAVT